MHKDERMMEPLNLSMTCPVVDPVFPDGWDEADADAGVPRYIGTRRGRRHLQHGPPRAVNPRRRDAFATIAPRARPSLEWATRAGIVFRGVPDWPYAVSRCGLVQSFHNATGIGPAIAPTPQRLLKPWRDLVRGPTVRLSRGRWGKPDYCRQAFAVVELVALAWGAKSARRLARHLGVAWRR